jgi:uncharacterized cupredoxin-like copper-binding protein
MRWLVPVPLVFVLAFAACGGGAKTKTTQEPKLTNEVSVGLSEYKFDVSGSLNAGLARLRISNTGQEQHMMAFAPLKTGVTIPQVVDALQKGGDEAVGPLLASEPERSPFFLSPGKSSEVITDIFTPANYVLLCFLPAPDGKSHVAKGMIGGLEVKQTTQTPVTLKTDGEVGMKEYSFTLADKLKTGKGTYKITNTGAENHDLVLIEGAPGKTRADVETYFMQLESDEGPPAGEPPAFFAGGTTSVKPGETMYLTIDLKPGTTYFAICTETTKDEKDHSDLGMIVEFKTP